MGWHGTFERPIPTPCPMSGGQKMAGEKATKIGKIGTLSTFPQMQLQTMVATSLLRKYTSK